MDKARQDRLKVVIAAYGADPRRWPEADQRALASVADRAEAATRDAEEIDAVLAMATPPAADPASLTRILQAIESSQDKKVVTFAPAARARPSLMPWLTALPLAASLAMGIYFGAQGTLDAYLPTSIIGDVASVGDDPSDLSGVSDVEDLTGDDLT